MDFDLKTYLDGENRKINQALEKLLPQKSLRIVMAMRHSLMAGGKRLRPVLCLAAADTVCGNSANALPAACAIEMIHTYSLIHDDLPAMDDDNLRRGSPTCHVKFDEASAILAGDGLLTLAFEILSSAEDLSAGDLSFGGLKNSDRAIDRLKIINRLSRAAGYENMIEGQMQDIASEGVLLDVDQLEKLHALKTGAMISASVYAGAVMGRASDEQISHLEEYAYNIGLAFQVADDILNVEGDPEIMGKAAGTDNDRGKNTYPALLGLKESKAEAVKLVDRAIKSLEIFDKEPGSIKSGPLCAIAKYIIERKL